MSVILKSFSSLYFATLLMLLGSGLLSTYLALRLAARRDNGDWPCLRLIKRPQYGWQRPVRTSGRTSQPPGDFGTW